MTISEKFDGFPHVIEAQQFSRDWIEDVLFPLAFEMEKIAQGKKEYRPLVGKEITSLFVGESLRTRARFIIAGQRLGALINFDSEAARTYSSMNKGESLEDTITTLDELGTDMIVLRYDEEGGAKRAAKVSEHAAIMNAGDGRGQHPTQALLDIFATKRHMGQIDGLSFAMIGDTDGSRTIHSFAYLLGRYKRIKIYFISPEDLRIKPNIKDYLLRHGVQVVECRDIREVASNVDVFYQTRTQTNLGTVPWDRKDSNNGFTIINKEVLDLAKKDSIILHPLPCLDEITRSEVDNDRRAVYIKTKEGRMSQVKGGLYITMALLKLILAPNS